MVVPTHEIVPVPVEVPVEVDPALLEKGELVAPNKAELAQMTTKDQVLHITAIMHWNTVRALQCYGNLDAIKTGHGLQRVTNGSGNE